MGIDYGVMTALADYVILGLDPGSFSCALIEQDRERAYARAHPILTRNVMTGEYDNFEHIDDMMKMVAEIPDEAKGDAAMRAAWKASGGLFGRGFGEHAGYLLVNQSKRPVWYIEYSRCLGSMIVKERYVWEEYLHLFNISPKIGNVLIEEKYGFVPSIVLCEQSDWPPIDPSHHLPCAWHIDGERFYFKTEADAVMFRLSIEQYR